MSIGHSLIALLFGLLLASAAGATDVTVAGLFPNKALVQIDGGPLQTLAIGQKTPQGVVLVSVDSDSATFEIEGKLVQLAMGHVRGAPSDSSANIAQLTADTRGHFIAQGQINGQPVRFIVDTGATLVVLPAAAAQRLGIDYRKGARGNVMTANGRATAYRVKFDKVTIGGITLFNVDGAVTEGEDPHVEALLGMSFLNRTDMRREGDIMTLTKRY